MKQATEPFDRLRMMHPRPDALPRAARGTFASFANSADISIAAMPGLVNCSEPSARLRPAGVTMGSGT